MKWGWLLFLVLAAVVVAQEEPEEDELPLAEPCNADTCQLPDCRCSSTNIPGGLAARDTPQFVMVTFDDAVNIINIETYRDTLYNRFNQNGCRAGATFYVSHEYTNYALVNELYNNGFEIALHSITHQTPATYWRDASVEVYRREIGDQKGQIAWFANIPESELHGVRIPFLQMGGNNSFVVKQEFDLTYDCSWPTVSFDNPGLWPYSLDYSSIQDCQIPPCPTASLPRTWVVPMVSWRDLQNVPCSMADGCFFTPPLSDEEAWFEFILGNFERHYKGNRAPFGYFVHEWYLAINPAVRRAYVRFLDMINNLPDVFMVNTKEVLDWVRDPIPIDQYRARNCRFQQTTTCFPTSCGPLAPEHNPGGADYWMTACTACPRVYPWLGNPFGL